jgi:hypothetical protein
MVIRNTARLRLSTEPSSKQLRAKSSLNWSPQAGRDKTLKMCRRTWMLNLLEPSFIYSVS